MDLNGFDANQVEPASDFEPLPKGWYKAMAVDSEEKATKSGNGSYLQFVFEVLEGKFQGRKLWARLNLNNPNATAVEIAQRDLSSICRATGVMAPSDSAQLHDKPIMVRVKQREYQGEIQNEVHGYKACDGATAPTPKPTPQPAGGGAAPWTRG